MQTDEDLFIYQHHGVVRMAANNLSFDIKRYGKISVHLENQQPIFYILYCC
jgi:hypothetical protein